MRTLKSDAALATVLKQQAVPSTDALGDWLRRTGEKAGLAGLGRINQRIAHVRLDSAGYQAGIFNYCEDTGKTFAIGGRLDALTQKAIADIPPADWKHYADCAVADTLHSMNETKKAFRLIVVNHERPAELFDDKPKYHVIASNRVEFDRVSSQSSELRYAICAKPEKFDYGQ